MQMKLYKKKAFTLIELLIVIAIIGILFIVLVSKVDFATDKAKATGVQTDFRSFQVAFDTVAKENAGFNTFGWDTGDANQDGIRNSYDEGDNGAGGGIAKNGIQDGAEVFTGHKVYDETFTKVFSLKKNGTGDYDRNALNRLETAINANLDPKLHITIKDDGEIVMANGAQDPWNKEYHGWYITNAENDKKDRGAIVIYSDGANNEFGSEHTIANGVVKIIVPGNNKAGKDDMSIVSCYTYMNGYGEVKNMTTGFSNNQSFVGQNNSQNNNNGNNGSNNTESLPEIQLEAGLYDSNNQQLVSWDQLINEYNLDLSKTYTSTDYLTSEQSLYSILNNNNLFESATKIIVGDNIRKIGSYAFGGCSNITSVYIPETIEKMEEYALDGCINIENLTLPFVGEQIAPQRWRYTVGWIFGMYEFENSLRVYHYGYSTTSDSTSTGYRRYIPVSLKNITILNGDIVPYSFADFEYVESINIPKTATYIGASAFKNCKAITDIKLPSYLTSIGINAFQDCTQLNKVNIDNQDVWFNISFTNKYSNPLYYTKSLYVNNVKVTKLIVPDGITEISAYSLYNNTSLTDIVLSPSVARINSSAFEQCNNLQNVYIENFEQWCRLILDNLTASPLSYGKTLYVNNQKLSGTVIIPDGITSINPYLLRGCSEVTSIQIPSSVSTINEYAFMECSSLKELVIPESVLIIKKGVLSGCISLETLTIPFIGETETPSQWWYTFAWLFSGSKYENTTYVTQSPCSISSENTHTQVSGSIPNSLKHVTVLRGKLPYGAFDECQYIESVSLPSTITEIGSNAFYDCANLKNIIIPNGVTSIKNYAFLGCENLLTVTLPNTVTTIGTNTFASTGIKTIYFSGTIDKWNNITKGNGWKQGTGNISVICSDGTISVN